MSGSFDPEKVADFPTYWFARLEKARDEADVETAAQCVRELRRLGFSVTCLAESP